MEIEETPEEPTEVKIEEVEVIHAELVEDVGEELWVQDIHKLWKDHATSIINLDQKLGHVLTSKIAP